MKKEYLSKRKGRPEKKWLRSKINNINKKQPVFLDNIKPTDANITKKMKIYKRFGRNK